MDRINFFNTYIDPNSVQKVSETLQSTFVSEGKKVKEFEVSLENKLGLKNVVAVNSGTSALHLGLVLAGVKEGDEVIIPSQTFIATGLAVLMQKAVPVFSDIQYHDGNLDPTLLEKIKTPKTKAIIPVHWAGRPCEMNTINSWAKENNIKVVEDAAHALGASYHSKEIGSISDFTCFSFQAIKHLTTGDGGAVCSKSIEKANEARRRRWFGLDRLNSKVSPLGERDCDVKELGYKYHLNDLGASLGLANLKHFKERLERRSQIASKYDSAFCELRGLTLFRRNDSERHSANWLYGLHAQNRDQFIIKLKEKGVPASVVHQGIDRFSIFKDFRTELPIQREFDKSQVHLPLHDGLTDEQVDWIIDSVIKSVQSF